MLISQAIPNLINGVSQQPPSLRLNSQCELQENGVSSVVSGLSKRPGTEYVANLGTIPNIDKAFIHTIRRDDTEFYSCVIDTTGTIKVFDKDGVSKTVTDNAPTYIGALADPATSLAAVSIGDATFIINKNVEVAKAATVTASRNPEALVYVKDADYSSTYRLILTKGVNTDTVEFATGSSTQASTLLTQQAERGASTDLIAENLDTFSATNISSTYYDNITNGAAVTGLTITRYENVLHIQSTDTTDFTVEVGDSHGGNHLQVFKGETAEFKKLPYIAPIGFNIKVSGDNNKAQDDYYVVYQGDKVWKESIAPAVLTQLDATTMPHKLVKLSNGNFQFDPIGLEDRNVGDDNTNSFPSFVGFTLADIFFYKNRMGLLADENVIFARAGEYTNFDFFRKSVLTIVDSDPIDVAVSANKVSLLRHAVPFNDTLIMFSDLTQFKLTGSPLTPETVNVASTTEFEASLRAKPKAAGKFIYFGSKRGEWSGMWEYFVDPGTDTNDASEISGHVPRYIAGEITNIQASSNEDMVLLQGEDEPNSIFVYQYFWSGRKNLQSAWSKWTFGTRVAGVSFNQTDVYLLMARGTELHLEKIHLSVDDATPYTTGDFGINLDRRVQLETAGLTTVPYTDATATQHYVAQSGAKIDVSKVAALLALGEKVWVGVPFTFKFEFSRPIVKQGEDSITTGKLHLKNYSLVYTNSGYFEIVIQPLKRTAYTRKFTGRILGQATNIIGTAAVDSGVYSFGVLGDAQNTTVTIQSSSHFPCTFNSAEWEGQFVLRSRRM